MVALMSLDLPLPVFRLPVGEHPDVGGNACVVEHVEGESNDGLEPVVLDDPAPDVALPLAGVPGEQGAPVVDFCHPAPQRASRASSCWPCWRGRASVRRWYGSPGSTRRSLLWLIRKLAVLEAGLAAHPVQVPLPALPVGRIAQHEVEGPVPKSVA